LPIALAVSRRQTLEPEGWVRNSVLAATGQPRELK
jgi:hypothetical protein